MSSNEHSDGKRMPPRKKDWVEGKYQIGLFIRFPSGDSVTLVNDGVDTVRSVDQYIKQLQLVRDALQPKTMQAPVDVKRR